MSQPLLSLRQVSIVFPVRSGSTGSGGQVVAVDDVSLDLQAGQCLALVGESGCGKSTIARAVCGLQPLSSGEVRIGGQERSGRQLLRHCQMVYQDPFSSLNPRLKVGLQITEPLRGLLGIRDRKELRGRAAELLRKVGLEAGHARAYPHQFSGGQRQRIALARAIAIDPELVVADEPLSSLDVQSQEQILDVLAEIKTEKRALLLISHDFSHVHRLADRVAVMKDGRIVERGEMAEVLSRPQAAYTRELLSSVPMLSVSE